MSSSTDQVAPNSYLPVPNPTTPYWRTDLHPLDSHHSTEDLPSQADVVIIGAGISGVSVAYHLSQGEGSPPSILLLEARQVCSGATGRNGGHAKVKTTSILELLEKDQTEEVEILTAFVGAHIDAYKDVVEREGLDCEFELRRSYDVYANEKDAAALRKAWGEYAGQPWTRSRQLIDADFAENVSKVMGSTTDGFPHGGEVPGRKGQWIIAGFNGGGMTMSFLLGKGVAQMVRHDLPFEEIDPIVPRFFKTTEARLAM